MVRSYLNNHGKRAIVALQNYYGRASISRNLTVVANTTVCCSLLGTADALQQLMAGTWEVGNDEKPWDWRRSRRFAIIGLYQGPLLYVLYRWMDFHIKYRGGRTAIALQKCFLDLITAPAFSSATIIGVGLQEGKKLSDCCMEYRQKFSTIFMLDCCTWPPFQFFNFMYLPNKYRVVYTNFIQLCYNIVMSYIKKTDT